MFDELTFDQALRANLKVMDATAFALCREQHLPIKVFNMTKHGSLEARRSRRKGRHARSQLIGLTR